MSGIGHNSGVDSVSHQRLRLYIERVERLIEDRKAVSDDIEDVMREAKAAGFDAKAMRAVIRLRAMAADKRREQKALLDTYAVAMGLSEFA